MLKLTRASLARRAGLLATAGVLVLGLAACGGSGSAGSGGSAANTGGGLVTGATGSVSAGAVVKGGDVDVTSSNGEMVGFDPVTLANIGTGIERAALVMDTLLYRDDLTGAVEPKLAQSMTSTDNKVWVLTLRPGVNFSDGTPLDAQAVIFNLNRHMAADSKSAAKALLSGIDTMVATGDHEITFTLKEVNGSFPIALTAASPASLIGSPKALADPATFATNPVGAGAFTLDHWTRDSEMKFVPNPGYWDTGKPYLNSVTFKPITDTQTIAASLQSGQAQVALLNASVWQTFISDPAVKLWAPVGGGAAIIPNGTRPIGDERVRQAISLALDPKTTNNVVFHGATLWDGSLDCIPFASSSPVCTSQGVPAPNVEQAKQLVADYVAGGGNPAAELTYFQSLTDQATYIQDQLKNIGLDITLKSVDATTLAAVQASGDYDLFYGSTASSGYPTVWTRLYSGGTNWGKVAYPELDEALMAARNGATLDERNAAWQKVLEVNRKLNVAIFMLPYSAAMGTSSKLHLDTGSYPYQGSTMQYFDSAWLEQ